MASGVVNISPFAVKLELWLRINNIKFTTVDDMSFSKKGQSPFVVFNGEQRPDSNMIISHLSTHFNKDLFPGLNSGEKATARAFIKMLEENTAWTIFIYRYIENIEEYAENFALTLPLEARIQRLGMIKESLTKRAHGHGIGRHDPEEIYDIGCQDIQAVSDFLADKTYMMGGDQPTLLDCVVFGVLSQVVYVPMKFPQRKYILEKCPNISRLMDHLRDTYWKNWQTECEM